jgi:putative colanic acid biosynthesis acetyltransferase WcaF
MGKHSGAKVEYSRYQNTLSLQNRALRLVWNVAAFFLFKPFILPLFNPWRVLLLRVFGARIGLKCSVDSSVKIWAPWNLQMEDCTLLAQHVVCYNPGKITLRTQTVISQYTYLCSASHDIHSSGHELIRAPIEIKDQVWVAVDAFIGPGVTVGQGAVVAARAVVFKDVEPWTVVAGNPAQFRKKRVVHANKLKSNSALSAD